jgi:hypothetical protein
MGNPISLIDPDGRSVVPTVTRDDSGNTTVDIKVTGKVINLSTNENASANKLAAQLAGIADGISGNVIDVTGLGVIDSDGNAVTGNATINFTFAFEAASKLSEVSASDHLITLADFGKSEATGKQLSNGVTSMPGGMHAFVDADVMTGPLDANTGYGSIVAGHEIVSHMLNAGHTKAGGASNITYGSSRSGVSFWSDQLRPSEASSITRSVYTGGLNNGPNLVSQFSTSTRQNIVAPPGTASKTVGSRPASVSHAGVRYRSVLNQASKKQ